MQKKNKKHMGQIEKVKNKSTFRPKTLLQNNICTLVLMAVLFTIANI